jgi:hypothetical protein
MKIIIAGGEFKTTISYLNVLTHISYFSTIQLMKLKSLSGMASADKLGEKYAEKGCYNFSQLIGKILVLVLVY